MLDSINCLAILPRCHFAYSAQFLQVIRDILKGILGELLIGNGLEILLGSDDQPSDSCRLYLFRLQICSLTIPKAVTWVTRLAWCCFC